MYKILIVNLVITYPPTIEPTPKFKLKKIFERNKLNKRISKTKIEKFEMGCQPIRKIINSYQLSYIRTLQRVEKFKTYDGKAQRYDRNQVRVLFF